MSRRFMAPLVTYSDGKAELPCYMLVCWVAASDISSQAISAMQAADREPPWCTVARPHCFLLLCGIAVSDTLRQATSAVQAADREPA